MVDDKLERDEAQRAANYEAMRSRVDAGVNADIAAEAAERDMQQQRSIESLADDMRHRAVDDVVETDREVERGRVAARVSQFVDYVFFLIYGLLAIRLLLELFAARETAAFFRFIRTVTGPFYAPFRGLVPSPSTPEGFTLALPVIVAIVAYMLLHLAINGLLRIAAHRKTTV